MNKLTCHGRPVSLTYLLGHELDLVTSTRMFVPNSSGIPITQRWSVSSQAGIQLDYWRA